MLVIEKLAMVLVVLKCMLSKFTSSNKEFNKQLRISNSVSKQLRVEIFWLLK